MKHWTITEEAEALHQRFDDLKKTGMGQAEFARHWSVPGGPSMVSQHIKGRRPIAIDAAIAYAAGFGCAVVDISPRLADVLNKAIGNTPNTPLAPASNAQAAINNAPASRFSTEKDRRRPLPLSALLDQLAALLDAVDAPTRDNAALMLASFANKPEGRTSSAKSLVSMLEHDDFKKGTPAQLPQSMSSGGR